MLLLVLPKNLTSAYQRDPPIFNESPGALERLATCFLHSSNTGTIGQLCNSVLLGQPNLYCAHSVILTVSAAVLAKNVGLLQQDLLTPERKPLDSAYRSMMHT